MLLRWLASTSTSAFHAADCLLKNWTLADAPVAAELAAPTDQLRAAIDSAGMPRTAFMEHVVAQSAGIGSNRELAEVALGKMLGRGRIGQLPQRFAGLLTAIESAFERARPKIVDELALRGEPMKDQWQARGPGLLHTIASFADDPLIVPAADAILVHPALGGGGASHWHYNSVRIEAVLANPIPELPEIVRLAWLLAQLHLDLPANQDRLGRPALERIGPIALIPPTLAAAERVELARYNLPTIRLALEAWRATDSPTADLAETLDRWWQTAAESRPRWPVALEALAVMLPGA